MAAGAQTRGSVISDTMKGKEEENGVSIPLFELSP